MKKFKDPVFLFNAFVLVCFIIFYSVARDYPEGAKKFPLFVLGIGVVVIIIWMIIYFFFPLILHFIQAQEEADEGDVASTSRFFLACLCIALSVLGGYLLGFLFLVPSAFLSYGLMLGDRKNLWTLIIVTLITSALFYIAFDYTLNIPLLRGAILNLGS